MLRVLTLKGHHQARINKRKGVQYLELSFMWKSSFPYDFIYHNFTIIDSCTVSVTGLQKKIYESRRNKVQQRKLNTP
jgi:hypothetical protein